MQPPCIRVEQRSAGAAGAAALAEALKNNASLTRLDLAACKLRADGVEALCAGLRSNTGLKALRLARNTLGDKGASAVARALPSLALHSLDLDHNAIRQAGAAAVARACAQATVRSPRWRVHRLAYLASVGNQDGAHLLGRRRDRAATLRQAPARRR